jgi:hypothetical protein
VNGILDLEQAKLRLISEVASTIYLCWLFL